MNNNPEALIQQADAKLKDREFESVIDITDRAIKADPTKSKPYLQQSIAAQRLKQYDLSLKMAEISVANAYNLGRREAIADGQFRRAIALYYLGQYADADEAFNLAKKYGSKDKSMEIWINKAQDKLESLGDDGRTVTIEDIPMERMVKEKPKPQKNKIEEIDDEEAKEIKEAVALKKEYQQAAAKPKPVIYDQNYRKDWYQNKTTVNVSLFLKNAPKDKTDIKFEPRSITVNTCQPSDGSSFETKIEPLEHDIDPAQSSFRVFGTKIELTLTKATENQWKQLVGDEGASSTETETASGPTLDEMRAALNEPKLPAVNGAKNWDKLAEAELEEWEKDEKEHGSSNDFFQTLFKDADEDTKRAMMKSYIESNGTALSTDWNEVKDKKYPVDPPSGMEAKSYPM